MSSHFFAYLARMKLIQRWGLMHNTHHENVQEHSLQVAVITHALAVIRNRRYGGGIDADKAATAALFHDASEVLTGDLPTPVKYFNDDIRASYKAIEAQAEAKLLSLLPADLHDDYRPLLCSEALDPEIANLIKAADTLTAYLKCVEEEGMGNHDFIQARKSLAAKLAALEDEQPEVRDFVRDFVPSFRLTLDEMSRDGGL